ncbi:MAG TPA: C-type lectin domain-containing protein [Kofleriaceae bacterium]|nr:C-type lectin domain-containing protein [Kofleriaceae bacterium]
MTATPIRRNVLVVIAGWNEMPKHERAGLIAQLERTDERNDQRKDGRSITVHGSDPREVAASFASALSNQASGGAVAYTIADVVDLTATPKLDHPFDDEIVNRTNHGVTRTLESCGIGVGTERLTFAQMWCLYTWRVTTAKYLAPLAAWLDRDPIQLDDLVQLPELNTPRALVSRTDAVVDDSSPYPHHEINEIWIFGAALVWKMPEWTEVTLGGRAVPVMGFAYTVRPTNMWESFAHRAEDYLSRWYGSSCQGRAYGTNELLSREALQTLTLCQKYMTTGTMVVAGNAGGFGTAHHPVNARNEATSAGQASPKDYDFANTVAAFSAGPAWDRKTDLVLWEPDAAGEPVDCGTWHCNEEDYQLWLFSHMPDGTATSRDGVTKLNWWEAITATTLVPPSDRDALELPRAGSSPCGAGEVRAGARCVALPAGCTGETYREHGYGFCSGGFTWQAAQDRCVAAGGHLVTIGDQYEQEFVISHRSNDQWIGLARSTTDCQWRWVTGEPLAYGVPFSGDGAWQAGMPDSSCGDQDCGSFWYANGWDDDWCGTTNASYICEWE